MNNFGSWSVIVIGLVSVLAISILIDLKRRKMRWKAMSKYWARTCTGRAWKRRFPAARKDEIREFLNQFVDAFAYKRKKRLKFSPDDKVMDIYHAQYPLEGMADVLELEEFSGKLKQEYGVDLAKVGRPDITLGELFELARSQGAGA